MARFASNRRNAMATFPDFTYTINDVRQAGKDLAQTLVWNDETAESIRRTFAVAHNWRDSHGYPMSRFRGILAGQVKRHKSEGEAEVVARLKRMPSIRQKLTKQQWPLDKIQDLAGCRAIVPCIKDARGRGRHAWHPAPHPAPREPVYRRP